MQEGEDDQIEDNPEGEKMEEGMEVNDKEEYNDSRDPTYKSSVTMEYDRMKRKLEESDEDDSDWKYFSYFWSHLKIVNRKFWVS